MHHNPHDSRSAERHSECWATWHLFVTHRKELRVPRREWRHGLLGHSTALMQNFASAGLALRAAVGRCGLGRAAGVHHRPAFANAAEPCPGA